MEIVAFYFLGLQNHADGKCSHEIESHLLLGRKAMSNLDCHIIKLLISRVITLLTKVHMVKAMVFPVGIYGLMLLKCGVGEDS